MMLRHTRTYQPTSNRLHALSVTAEDALYVHLPSNQDLQILPTPKGAVLPEKGKQNNLFLKLSKVIQTEERLEEGSRYYLWKHII